jgi:hypothetical protein
MGHSVKIAINDGSLMRLDVQLVASAKSSRLACLAVMEERLSHIYPQWEPTCRKQGNYTPDPGQ